MEFSNKPELLDSIRETVDNKKTSAMLILKKLSLQYELEEIEMRILQLQTARQEKQLVKLKNETLESQAMLNKLLSKRNN